MMLLQPSEHALMEWFIVCKTCAHRVRACACTYADIIEFERKTLLNVRAGLCHSLDRGESKLGEQFNDIIVRNSNDAVDMGTAISTSAAPLHLVNKPGV